MDFFPLYGTPSKLLSRYTGISYSGTLVSLNFIKLIYFPSGDHL